MFAVKSSKVRKVNNFHVRPNTTLFQCVPQQLLFEYNGRTNDKNKWENNEKKIFLRLFFSLSRKQKDQLLAEKFPWANLVEWHRFHFFLLISFCVSLSPILKDFFMCNQNNSVLLDVVMEGTNFEVQEVQSSV